MRGDATGPGVMLRAAAGRRRAQPWDGIAPLYPDARLARERGAGG